MFQSRAPMFQKWTYRLGALLRLQQLLQVSGNWNFSISFLRSFNQGIAFASAPSAVNRKR